MELDPTSIGPFDVVLFLGVLYHMDDPLGSLRRLATLTNETAIIETEAVIIGGMEDRALAEFFPSDELAHDPTNWWSPNGKAVIDMCRAAGFSRVEQLHYPTHLDLPPGMVHRYRAYFHAHK